VLLKGFEGIFFHYNLVPTTMQIHVRLIFLLLFIFIVRPGAAQQWFTKTYGSNGLEYNGYADITPDSGFILFGSCDSDSNSFDFYIVRADKFGDTLWTHSFGGNLTETNATLQQTSDDGFILSGTSQSFNTGYQISLIKIDHHGDLQWSKFYTITGNDRGTDVMETADHGFIVSGWGNFGNDYRMILMRTDNLGNPYWANTYGFGGNNREFSYCVRQTSDGGFILGGSSYLNKTEMLFIRTDANGDTLWERSYGFSGSSSEIMSIEKSMDGGYLITGGWKNGGNNYKCMLLKTDSLGNKIFCKAYGIGLTLSGEGKSIHELQNGNILLSGEFEEGGPGRFFLLECDLAGNILRVKTFGGIYNYDYGGFSQLTIDGNILLTGSSNGDLFAVKTSFDDTTSCHSDTNTAVSSVDVPDTAQFKPIQVQNNSFINTNPQLIPTISHSATVLPCFGDGFAEISNERSFQVLPNPFTESITVNSDDEIMVIRILDAIGKVRLNIERPGFTTHINTSSLASGIYFLHAETKNGMVTRKIIRE